jgi:hypothetical protein
MFSEINRFEIITGLMPLTRYGCKFRLVDENDAEFIFKLRTNPVLAKFLNPVTGNADNQRKWISEYKKRETAGNDFYFICLDAVTGLKQGLNRIHNFRDLTFEAGSWLYLPHLDFSRSILGDILVREIAHDILHFKNSTFEVRKGNMAVIKYFKLYSPELISEDNRSYYFNISIDAFNYHKKRILNLFGY